MLLCLVIFLSMNNAPDVTDRGAAVATQVEGIYIFMLCKPATDYHYLGTVEKKGIVMTGKPDEMLKIMVKKVKKQYPTAEGIIFTELNMYKADCINF